MIVSGIVLAAQVAGLSACPAPLELTLNEPEAVQVAVQFACPGQTGTLTLQSQCGKPISRRHAFTRASVRVDRNGSKTLRLIDRQERANDLYYRDGAVELWRNGRRLWRRVLAKVPACHQNN